MTAAGWIVTALAWIAAACGVAWVFGGAVRLGGHALSSDDEAPERAEPCWAYIAWPAASLLAIALSCLWPMGFAS